MKNLRSFHKPCSAARQDRQPGCLPADGECQ